MTSIQPLRSSGSRFSQAVHTRHTPSTNSTLKRRNRLVVEHRDLVRPIALRYVSRCREALEDLEQVGLLGLIRAAELYRRDVGTPFQGFARPHIRGAILHYLRDEAPPVRLPRRQAELQTRLQRLEEDRRIRNDGSSTGNPLSAPEANAECVSLLMRHRQLCRPLPLEEALLEGIAAPEPQEEDRLIAIRVLLEDLDPRQRQVVTQVVLGGASYRRLAREMEVSPMTVQRLLHRGLESLRRNLEILEIRKDRPVRRVGSGFRGS
ncbi:MAG: sigma-70 family RNA polymerase sigma factor [Cyanobium sp.]